MRADDIRNGKQPDPDDEYDDDWDDDDWDDDEDDDWDDDDWDDDDWDDDDWDDDEDDDDVQVVIEYLTPEERMWNQIKQHLPEHMQDDPRVARQVGFLIGMGAGNIIEFILRKFG